MPMTMTAVRNGGRLAVLAALGLVTAGTLLGEEKSGRGVAKDRGKGVVESPLKGVLAGAAGAKASPQKSRPTDMAKMEIETATKVAVGNGVGAAAAAPAFVNPKVAPGKVQWHESFAVACERSRKSGKPVLLFQMMGKLDDQFC
jgi:hypothetical protein